MSEGSVLQNPVQSPDREDIAWSSTQLRELRRSMISSEELSRLSKRSQVRWMTLVGFDLSLILLTATVTEYFFSMPLYLAAIIIIAGRQVGIASIALHEGAHRFLSNNATTNHRIGTIFLSALTVPCIGIDIESYRKGHHLDHHRFLLQENDPENELFANLYAHAKTKTLANFISMSFLTLSGIGYLYALLSQIAIGPMVLKLVNGLFIAIMTAGLFLDVYVIKLLFLYWIVPIATWALFVNSIRAMAEHYPSNAFGSDSEIPQELRTRDVVPSLFDKLFVTTRNVNLHLSHHLFPAVPFYNLHTLQQIISKTDTYRKIAHQTKGYHRFIYEYLVLRPEQTTQESSR